MSFDSMFYNIVLHCCSALVLHYFESAVHLWCTSLMPQVIGGKAIWCSSENVLQCNSAAV